MASSQPVHLRRGQPESDSDLHDVAHLVHEEFDDQIDPRQVDECLSQVAARFAEATVRSFIRDSPDLPTARNTQWSRARAG